MNLIQMKKTNMVNDKIKGVIFGQAIGDALGLGTEFMNKKEVDKYYPNGLTYYDQIIQDYHRKRWAKGAWTDDTDMMLCIANAIIKDKDIRLSTIAQNFKDWFNGEPLGIGSNTFKVLSFKDYTDSPQKGAEIIWICLEKRVRQMELLCELLLLDFGIMIQKNMLLKSAN